MPGPTVVTEMMSGLSSMSSAIGSAKAAMGTIEDAGMDLATSLGTVASKVTDTLQQMAASIQPFVQAFNPSAVLAFGDAMYDLQAVIGLALVPVMEALTAAARDTGDILLPVMREMEPIFRDLMAVALEVGQAFRSGFSGVLSSLMPLVEILADLTVGGLQIFAQAVRNLGALMSGVAAVVSSIFQRIDESIGSLTGGNLMETLRTAFQTLSKYVLLAVASLARFLGATSFVAGMIRGLQGVREGSGGTGAPRDARVGTDIQSYARQLAEQMATATVTGQGPASTEQWLQETVRELQALRNGQQTILDTKLKEVKEWAEEKLGETRQWAERQATELAKQLAAEAIRLTPPGRLAAALGLPLGRR